MLNVLLALIMGYSFVMGDFNGGPNQFRPANVEPGRVAWFDITTTSLPRSKEFYGKLFDWKFILVPGSEHAATIVAGDQAIGTLRDAEGPISAFNGIVYIQVTDIQASCKKVMALGGKVGNGFPLNLPGGAGAIAVATDPVGHPFGMYSSTPFPSVSRPSE
jgi:predicted enzyme related to lactoylglutathione lyase